MKSIQTGGTMVAWRNQDNTFRHAFLKLFLDCELDNRAGVVIISDENSCNATAFKIVNLNKELPVLLRNGPMNPSVHWWATSVDECEALFQKISKYPIFVG